MSAHGNHGQLALPPFLPPALSALCLSDQRARCPLLEKFCVISAKLPELACICNSVCFERVGGQTLSVRVRVRAFMRACISHVCPHCVMEVVLPFQPPTLFISLMHYYLSLFFFSLSLSLPEAMCLFLSVHLSA